MLRKNRLRIPLLIIGSYIFYSAFDWRFPVLLLTITTCDYFIGRGIAACSKNWARKLLLTCSCIINLGILCTFKYLNFFFDNLQSLFDVLEVSCELPELEWILPVGLSFFTFKSLSYTCDVYFKKIRAEKNFLLYAAYVSFFPQLVAGPIERARTLLPQLRHRLPWSWDDLSAGASLLILGIFKKAVLADTLALYLEPMYSNPAVYDWATLLAASYAFSWQIYFDFSGYSDMARGAARFIGFRTPLNFNDPYVASDVQDFWRRWHISLSLWFRDYLYIPLGGNRCGKIRVWTNVMITMLLSGLWHGANWTFIVWGGLNGVGSIFSSETSKSKWYQSIPLLIRQILVFNFITLTWIFFRSSSFEDAFTIIKRIFCLAKGENSFVFPTTLAAAVGIVWIYQLIRRSRFSGILDNKILRIVLFIIVLLATLLLGGGANSQFIYQQF